MSVAERKSTSDDVNTFSGESMGYEGAGDATPDDGDITPPILVEAGIGRQQSVPDDPERGTRGEVHATKSRRDATVEEFFG